MAEPRRARARVSAGVTKYKSNVPGDRGNYRWPVTFDYDEDGYLGISQPIVNGTSERVLLSPSQLAALRAFTRRRPTSAR